MALETFNFCPNSLVPETVPPETTSVMSMNGCDFRQKTSVPYRRKFKVAIHAMNWDLLANGRYDDVHDPTKRDERSVEKECGRTVRSREKPAYDMRISDWSSDVCSSDLPSGACSSSDAWPSRRSISALTASFRRRCLRSPHP